MDWRFSRSLNEWTAMQDDYLLKVEHYNGRWEFSILERGGDYGSGGTSTGEAGAKELAEYTLGLHLSGLAQMVSALGS